MRRRSRAGGEPVKTRHRKTVTLKRRNAPKAARRRSSSAANLREQLDLRTRELQESLDREAATSEVLRVISSSPGDLKPVFAAILENATQICQANFGTLYLCEGDAFRAVAMRNVPPAFAEARRREPVVRPSPSNPMVRVAATKRILQISDLPEDSTWPLDDAQFGIFAKLTGARSAIVVPMLKDDTLIGVVSVYRLEAQPFTDKQAELLTNFAAQAVIAIENTRLLNELRQSLDQQTATAEVLRVISSSPGELEPVFNAMLENATRVCEAKFGMLYRYQGDRFRLEASYNAPSALIEYQSKRGWFEPRVGAPLHHLLQTREVVHGNAPAVDPAESPSVRLGGAQSSIAVPMFKDTDLVGAIFIFRQEKRPFTEKHVALVTNFAAQAVIAIENTRLLNELRQSLEQQTATANVLRIISSSPSDLRPTFDALAENAARLCDGVDAYIQLREANMVRYVAHYGGTIPTLVVGGTRPLTPGLVIGRAILEARLIHILDLQAESEEFPEGSAIARRNGWRTIIAVPLMREGFAIGTIAVRRAEAKLFSDKQVELLSNFAAQAVIAIENARLLNELRESLEQQTATSEVLRVISSSPGELEPVFASMLENAVRICEAKFGNIYRWEDDALHLVASHNTPPAFAQARRRSPFHRTDTNAVISRLLATKAAVHVVDAAAQPGYIDRSDHGAVAAVELGGVRTALALPMLRENELIGSFTVYRQEVRPFTDKQIALVQNFAAQAVIAIENARLLNELRQSLDQQTATAEVLGVISSSPGDLQPVFDNMLRNAVRICDAKFGLLVRFDGEAFHMAAEVDLPSELAEFEKRRGPFLPPAGTLLDRVMKTKRVSYTADMAADAVPGSPARLGGARSAVAVPMLKDDKLMGVMFIYRQEVRPFADKQITLLQNFAAQAVIAIENTRLLNELRQRTADLTESLEQQTATSKVLEVISRSAFDLQAVFETVAASSVRLCGADRAFIYRFDGELLRMALALNAPQALKDFLTQNPIRPGRYSSAGRAALERQTNHIPDVLADPEYSYGSKDVGALRTVLSVPILKGNDLLGVVGIYTLEEVRPFTDKQIALVETFADQAAIAIDNVRLLDELRQSLQQQTATADVLKIISRSTFDLKTVLNTLVESAARLCEADMASVPRVTGGILDHFASYGYSPAFHEFLQNNPTSPGRGTVSGRAVLEGRTVHIPDVLTDPEYDYGEGQKVGGYRTLLGVPLMREGAAVGALLLGRAEPRPFTPQQIELLETFADQAVIAIENVRLFDEIQDKSRQLEIASQHKSQFLANISHELRTPLNAILGYTELMTDGAYGEPSEKMLGILKRLEANGKHLLGLINDVLDLSKIEAGQLVLELSDYSVQDIAQTVRSTLEPLAADKKLAFKVEVVPDLPPGRGDGRRLTQVLINLVGNAIKFTDAGEVAIKAEANNGSFYVSVRDTGPGISAADQAKLFQEFQQADNTITRKKGGTGLGLAISKRIIEMHGGKIWVELQPGQGSTFAFTLPVIVERQAEPA